MTDAIDGLAALVRAGYGELEVLGGEELRRGILQLDEGHRRDSLANAAEDLRASQRSARSEQTAHPDALYSTDPTLHTVNSEFGAEETSRTLVQIILIAQGSETATVVPRIL